MPQFLTIALGIKWLRIKSYDVRSSVNNHVAIPRPIAPNIAN